MDISEMILQAVSTIVVPIIVALIGKYDDKDDEKTKGKKKK